MMKRRGGSILHKYTQCQKRRCALRKDAAQSRPVKEHRYVERQIVEWLAQDDEQEVEEAEEGGMRRKRGESRRVNT